jgi:hypothetical protein
VRLRSLGVTVSANRNACSACGLACRGAMCRPCHDAARAALGRGRSLPRVRRGPGTRKALPPSALAGHEARIEALTRRAELNLPLFGE